jgi:integrase
MASLIQRGAAWRAMVVRKGKRVSATFDTRAEAERWGIHTEAAILDGARVDVVAPRLGNTVEALFQRYADQVSPTKRGCRWEQIRLKMLAREFAVFRGAVQKLDAAALADWRDARLATVSAYTVNRELNLISAVMNKARKEWRVPGVKDNPVHAIERPANPRPRGQRVSPAQRTAILKALGWDGVSRPADSKQWTAFAFSLALETAMRKGEIVRIEWQYVRLGKRHIHLPMTKNGDERDVPLSSRAAALIGILPPGTGTAPLVPVTIGNLDKLMRDARDATGLREVRFHDSRREAATTMSKRLSNVLELAAVTGHKSLQVLKGYYKPDAEDLADKLG